MRYTVSYCRRKYAMVEAVDAGGGIACDEDRVVIFLAMTSGGQCVVVVVRTHIFGIQRDYVCGLVLGRGGMYGGGTAGVSER